MFSKYNYISSLKHSNPKIMYPIIPSFPLQPALEIAKTQTRSAPLSTVNDCSSSFLLHYPAALPFFGHPLLKWLLRRSILLLDFLSAALLLPRTSVPLPHLLRRHSASSAISITDSSSSSSACHRHLHIIQVQFDNRAF